MSAKRSHSASRPKPAILKGTVRPTRSSRRWTPSDDFSVSGIATQDTTNLPTTWGEFTISLEITQDQLDHLLQFGFQTNASDSEGSGNFYDNVLVTKKPTAGEVVYAQDFNSLDIDGTFIGDGWRFFVNVFEGDGTFRFGFTSPSGNAPNGQQISALVDDQGGPDQQPQQLSVYSDYECCDPDQGHRNGTDLVETNVFEERTIGADDVGKTFTFSFQAKAGNIEGSSTANAFIKTLDPSDDFAVSGIATQDTTNLPTTWGDFTISLGITQDQLDHLLQFGFQTNASDSEGSGNFYDNVLVTKSGGDGTGGTGGTGGARRHAGTVRTGVHGRHLYFTKD